MVTPPSVPGASMFFKRILANVPRVMTRSLPRREPKLLKSCGLMPACCKYCPAGPLAGMAPAGEMWSVVTELPSNTSTRAPVIGAIGAGSGGRSTKNGGSLMYVLPSSQE